MQLKAFIPEVNPVIPPSPIPVMLDVMLEDILSILDRFWLKSHTYFEQPVVHFTYDYLLVAETDDPSQPIVCGNDNYDHEENCAEILVEEYDSNRDGNYDILEFKLKLNLPPGRTIASVLLILGLDFQLKMVCPLHMQGLAVISKEFSLPSSGLIYYGDLRLYQTIHLPCMVNNIDTKYNHSLFNQLKDRQENAVDAIIRDYFIREAIVMTQTLHSRSQNSHTGTMHMNIRLRVPETEVLYKPSLLQELKWAWPQYLSIVAVFYWIFNKIKKFVFNNRLLMAWEVVTWKRNMERKYFWAWTDFQSYVDCMLVFSVIGAAVTYLLIGFAPFVELIGFMAVFTEAMLGAPQIAKNHQNKSTEGMSLSMVIMWTCGDIFKTAYFVMREAPTQFWVCGALQVSLDVVILIQMFFFRYGCTGTTRRRRDARGAVTSIGQRATYSTRHGPPAPQSPHSPSPSSRFRPSASQTPYDDSYSHTQTV
ncbi:hypothetical protein MSG28_002339 [Choristoneura fumiferana]|uniref:Uncharacterized protein n=1 Tax=Choristoneura fumiferana TaxID=7141 RepID=A0ACC0JUZ9_CHOFU|nr:hypothetical protein MSG28_002339 [Choristoneura fumiferana]